MRVTAETPDLFDHLDRLAERYRVAIEHAPTGWRVKIACPKLTAVVEKESRELLYAVADAINAAHEAGLEPVTPTSAASLAHGT